MAERPILPLASHAKHEIELLAPFPQSPEVAGRVLLVTVGLKGEFAVDLAKAEQQRLAVPAINRAANERYVREGEASWVNFCGVPSVLPSSMTSSEAPGSLEMTSVCHSITAAAMICSSLCAGMRIVSVCKSSARGVLSGVSPIDLADPKGLSFRDQWCRADPRQRPQLRDKYHNHYCATPQGQRNSALGGLCPGQQERLHWARLPKSQKKQGHRAELRADHRHIIDDVKTQVEDLGWRDN